jgi:hypothetical protein
VQTVTSCWRLIVLLLVGLVATGCSMTVEFAAVDGSDVGEDGYELYVVGTDAATMWKVLEPVFAQAPATWDRVELRDGLDDPHPTVIRR